MKIILIFFVVLFFLNGEKAVSVGGSKYLPDFCAWQVSKNNISSRLSSNGKAVVNRILNDTQIIYGAALQAVYYSISIDFSETIKKIVASDSQAWNQFLGFIGYRNINYGLSQNLVDLCVFQAKAEYQLSSFKPEIKPLVISILDGLGLKLKPTYYVVNAIVAQKDQSFISTLSSTEKPEILKALIDVFGYSFLY